MQRNSEVVLFSLTFLTLALGLVSITLAHLILSSCKRTLQIGVGTGNWWCGLLEVFMDKVSFSKIL